MPVLTYKIKVIDKMNIGMIYEIILDLEHIMKQFHYLLHLHFLSSWQTIVCPSLNCSIFKYNT